MLNVYPHCLNSAYYMVFFSENIIIQGSAWVFIYISTTTMTNNLHKIHISVWTAKNIFVYVIQGNKVRKNSVQRKLQSKFVQSRTMASRLSQEEENYVRMSLLLRGISPRAARVLFDREFSPTCLYSSLKNEYNTLRDLQKKRIINQSQWNLLFPIVHGE